VSQRATYHLTRAECDALAVVYLEGRLAMRQIDHLFGCSEGITRDLVKRLGLPRRGRGWRRPVEVRG
jgi:hypothetical protein